MLSRMLAFQICGKSGPRLAMLGLLALSTGCALWRDKSGDETDNESNLRELLTVPEAPDLIREAAVPRGLRPISIEGVGVVDGLPGTGGPADPSAYRDQLLEELKRNDVANPNNFLELKETALVLVRGVIPPGARRGDPIDLKVIAPPRSRVENLHGGWLLDTRLRHQQVLNSSVRKSEVMAMATGPMVTRATHEAGEDEILRTQGRIISGGRIQADRKLGLILRPQYQHVKISSLVAAAINQRFFFFDGTTRRGVAKALEDDFIEVEIHPRYRDNPYRMISVILAMSTGKASVDRQSRLVELATQLKDPVTAADAALQLEALGENAIPTLLEGLESSNPELRFYAAETLAYLDRNEAIPPLAEAARTEPAFRHSSLSALEGMPQQQAVDALTNLFDEQSLETRYGAFVAVRSRDSGPRILAGKTIGDDLRLYEIPSKGRPAVAIALRKSPEVVVFGELSPLQLKGFLLGPNGLILKPEPARPSKIRVSRFSTGQDDQRVVVDKLRAINRPRNQPSRRWVQ